MTPDELALLREQHCILAGAVTLLRDFVPTTALVVLIGECVDRIGELLREAP